MFNIILGVVIGLVWGVVAVLIIWKKENNSKNKNSDTLKKAVNYYIRKHYNVMFDETCKNGMHYLSVSDVMEIAQYFVDWKVKNIGEEGIKQVLQSEEGNMIDETIYFIQEFRKSNRCADEGDFQNSVTCEDWLRSLKEMLLN
jgi:hypothetical protein